MEQGGKRISPKDLIMRLRDLYTVERVYGEPIEIQGKTIIPVAQIGAGGGGGGGEGPLAAMRGEGEETEDVPAGETTGSGSGFGFAGGAKPVGFLVVDGGQTRWVPVVDAEKVIMKMLGIAAAVVKAVGRKAGKQAGKKGKGLRR